MGLCFKLEWFCHTFHNPSFIICFFSLAETGQQIQEVVDPPKWQIVTVPSIPVANNNNNNNQGAISQSIGDISFDDDGPKQRVRRVACSCPNCVENDRNLRYVDGKSITRAKKF